MRKPKFEIGQTVHVPNDYYDSSKTAMGKILNVQITEVNTKVKNKNRKSTQIFYLVKFHNSMERQYPEGQIYSSKNDFHARKRKKDKSSAQSSVTRIKKTLEKNEQKLAELQKSLELLTKG